MLTVAIIGAGPLGRRLALAAARAGFRVLLEDVMPAALHHAQEYMREQFSAAALASAAGSGPGQPRIAFVSSIEDAVRDADLVIDCVPDELESKLEILWLLDRMAPPRTVFATPTTRLSISDLADCTYRPGKCIAIVAQAAEMASGLAAGIALRTTSRTSAHTVALVDDFWRNLGVEPRFECEPDTPGKPALASAPPAR